VPFGPDPEEHHHHEDSDLPGIDFKKLHFGQNLIYQTLII
jgi:hypothetical protein